jgi:hydroxymethylpyrimidine pyrophosphatase-like HAD family hydrolase
MPDAIRVVALDYDGTLTQGQRPAAELLDELARVRSAGRAVVLVTGRILGELRADFPEVDEHFDLIVAENGAVLSRRGAARDIVTPVDPRLGIALTHRDVPIRQGRVLLACDAVHDAAVLAEVTRLGLDCQLVRNRAALMVLPAGVTKGTGLLEGLAELGLSRHSTLAVGDAENDHSLLEVCEVGAAVGDAVEALKDHADLVLDAPNGAGVHELLGGPVLRGKQRVHSTRWQIEIGTGPNGTPMRIPASQLNVLIIGASGAGKSYAAGLLAEQALGLGYSVLVLDAAGEHRDLERLRGTLAFGGDREPLPPPDRIGDLLSHRYGSLVLDLSLQPGAVRHGYVAEIAAAVQEHRATVGLPHWVVMEEAHVLAGPNGPARELLTGGATSHCLVTYHPMELHPKVSDLVDVVLAGAEGTVGREQTVAYLAAFSGRAPDDVDRALAAAPRGGAVVARRDDPGVLVPVSLGDRATLHIRHQHKYAEAELPRHLRFFFARGNGGPGPVAANIGQLHDVLAACDGRLITFHTQRADFSRWIRDVLTDTDLAEQVATIEQASDADTETVRHRLLRAVEARYL